MEARNLSTQPYGHAEVGAPKARALANTLFRTVQARVEPAFVELTAGNAAAHLAGSVLLVDAFDNRAGRAAMAQAAMTLDVPCLHMGFSGDGLYGSGVWEPGYRLPDDPGGDPCDYPLTRPFALVLVALAARAIVEHCAEGTRRDFELIWRDLAVTWHDRGT